MATAEVGDDVFGDDPTVNELESYVAKLFQKEAGLYVPSGTMGNQISLKAASQRGWELLCERECHAVNYEVAGPAVHSGLLVNLLTTDRGMISAQMVIDNIRPKSIHAPETRIVTLENTHNRHGGTVLPQVEVVKVKQVCERNGLWLHLDGARIWNAHVAGGLPLSELVQPFDSVSVCFSKGLGAPIGSMILGSAEFIEKCRRERKLFGGGMRQVGIIAAGALYAVKYNISRLADDHANAKLLATDLNETSIFTVDKSRVETNIVVAKIKDGSPSEAVSVRLKELGVLSLPFGRDKLRFVTHLDVSADDCREALARIKKQFN